MTTLSLRDGSLVSGVIAISVGSYLPWVKLDPGLPPDAAIPMVYVSALNAGFDGFDLALLGVTGVVLLLRRVSSPRWVQSVVTLLVGAGTTLLCAYYLSTSSFVGVTALYVPALGWYLVLTGGLLLSVAGGCQSPSVLRRLEATATPKD